MNRRWELRSARPLPERAPGVERDADGWALRWHGCAVMGVVNVTPDSFSDGGLHFCVDDAVAHGLLLARQGALVIDVGGESTRPGASEVTADVEMERVLPVISRLAAAGTAMISVDTRKPEVAVAAIEAGANVVNDVDGLRDPAMIAACSALGVPAVVVHMQGQPADMQRAPQYADVVAEVGEWLDGQARRVLDGGVPSVMVDPGIGFGKSLEHNVALLRAVPLGSEFPMLVGASRKRMIATLLGRESTTRRDPGSIAVHLLAAQRGAAMVRVHDVAVHIEALEVDHAVRGSAR